MREEVKINASIRNKEVLRKRATEQRRGSTVLRADRDFEKIIEDFEEQKNKDLKELMLNYVKIQLKVHLDGVNHLTNVYKILQDVDCSKDAIKFKETILDQHVKEEALSKDSRGKSQSMGALNTLMNSWRLSHPKQPIAQSTENILDPPKITLEEDTQDSAEEASQTSGDDGESGSDAESLKGKTHLQVSNRY